MAVPSTKPCCCVAKGGQSLWWCVEGVILPLFLHFSSDVPCNVQSRIIYAFRVFAAIYGHSVVERDSAAAVRCFYGCTQPPEKDARLFHIPALYQDRKLKDGNSALARHNFAGQDFYLSFGIDPGSSRPDWLGELFLWLSSAYEASIQVRDNIGRIPYSQTIFSRQGISPLTAHASLVMAWMENTLRHGNGMEALPTAPCPVSGSEHLVVCSHDIDFYFTDRASNLVRLIKNLGIAVLAHQSWPHFLDTLRLIPQAIAGRRFGHYLPALMEANARQGVRSTFFAGARKGHRRDPNYRLEQIAPCLREASKNGFSIGLHGSYRSIIEDQSLSQEAHSLSESLGQKPLGGRQHWLRFSRHQDLFAEVAQAGLVVDSSLGFPDMVGFRNGASFAFPPYDFDREAPCPFLEIPLVLMDGSLEAASRQLHVPADHLAEKVLEESRTRGWGGIAVLWHNPLEALSVPAEINDVYWRCASRQRRSRERWIGVDQFLAAALPRYQQAGLLQGVRLDD